MLNKKINFRISIWFLFIATVLNFGWYFIDKSLNPGKYDFDCGYAMLGCFPLVMKYLLNFIYILVISIVLFVFEYMTKEKELNFENSPVKINAATMTTESLDKYVYILIFSVVYLLIYLFSFLPIFYPIIGIVIASSIIILSVIKIISLVSLGLLLVNYKKYYFVSSTKYILLLLSFLGIFVFSQYINYFKLLLIK